MTTKAQIVVNAVDKTSATMLRIRAEMRAMTKPMRDIKTSMGRFTDASGLKQMGHDMQKIARTARSVAGGITSIIAPIGALVGVGTIAGIGELSRRWGEFGWNVSRTAKTIGIAPQKLMALQGAAKLAGLSAEDMASGLHSLGEVVYNSKWGGDNQTAGMMRALGMQFHQTKAGGVDAAATLLDLSKAIQHYAGNAQLQEKIARQFGVESLLPLLRQGPDVIREYEAEARRLGYTLGGETLNRTEALGKSFVRLELSLTGLRNSIADSLYPVMQPMLGSLVQWISANRVLIGQKVSEWVQGIVQWFKSVNWTKVWSDVRQTASEIASIASGINGAVQAVGGWKNALELAFGAVALGKITLFTAAILKLGREMRGLPSSTPAPGSKGPGLPATAVRAGFYGWLADQGLRLVDPNDRFGGWLDAHVPGAAWVDNAFHHVGLGRSYAEQNAAAIRGGYAPRGIRNNNPGNIRYGDFAKKHGATGSDNGGYAIFSSMAMGQAAQLALLRSYRSNGRDSISSIIDRYAPSSENDTSAYVASVSRQTGLSATQALSDDQLRAVAYAMQVQEVGSRYKSMLGPMPTYSKPGIQAVTAPQAMSISTFGQPQSVQVEVSMKNMPPGTRAEARDGKGKLLPIRVGYSMIGQPG